MDEKHFEADFHAGLKLAAQNLPLPAGASFVIIFGHDFGRAMMDTAAGRPRDPNGREAYQRSYSHNTGADLRIAGKPAPSDEDELGGWDHQDGAQAFAAGEPFDPDKASAWRHGWNRARADAGITPQPTGPTH